MNQVWVKVKDGYRSVSVPDSNLPVITKDRVWLGQTAGPDPSSTMVVEYSSARGNGEVVEGYGNFR